MNKQKLYSPDKLGQHHTWLDCSGFEKLNQKPKTLAYDVSRGEDGLFYFWDFEGKGPHGPFFTFKKAHNAMMAQGCFDHDINCWIKSWFFPWKLLGRVESTVFGNKQINYMYECKCCGMPKTDTFDGLAVTTYYGNELD